MMYAQKRGRFYVQLEDDIYTKPNFIATMRGFAVKQTMEQKTWFMINFCQLGFIGKMFASANLPLLIQFLLTFYNDKPGDWLLDNFLTTKGIYNKFPISKFLIPGGCLRGRLALDKLA